MKNLATISVNWNKRWKILRWHFQNKVEKNIGDIFNHSIIREDIVRVKEDLFEANPSPKNRMVLQLTQGGLKKYLHYRENIGGRKHG